MPITLLLSTQYPHLINLIGIISSLPIDCIQFWIMGFRIAKNPTNTVILERRYHCYHCYHCCVYIYIITIYIYIVILE
jgi:hypothetical protein